MRIAWLALIAACGSDPKAMIDASTTGDDAAIDGASIDASLPITWETLEEISNDGSVIVERVSYRSDGLKIFARQCRPVDTGQHPIIVYNHGGFQGLDVDPEVARCQSSAAYGYVWLGSSYRGEEGSEGSVEVCLGEVTDVLEMVRIGSVQAYANGRVFMYGGSHGGCITQRAVQRGAPVFAAVDIFGPTDWTALYAFWRANQASNSFYAQLMAVMDTATGGPPETQPAEYAARSPINFVGDFPSIVPLLVTHGSDDNIVPPVQSCNLAGPAGMPSWHVDATGATLVTAPPGCGVPSETTNRPQPNWAGTRFLVVYDGLGHETSSAAAMVMLQDAATFLMAKQ